MDKIRFRFLALVWLGTLAAYVVFSAYLFPDLFKLFVGGNYGKSEVILTVVGMVLAYLLGILIFCMGIGWVTHKRLRALKVSYKWTIAVIFWILGSLVYIAAFGVLLRMQIGFGFFMISPPVLLLMLLVFMGFLALRNNSCSSVDNDNDRDKLPWLIAGLATSHAIMLWLGMVVSILMASSGRGAMLALSSPTLAQKMFLKPGILTLGLDHFTVSMVDLAIFTAALVYILMQEGPNTNAAVPNDNLSIGKGEGKLREFGVRALDAKNKPLPNLFEKQVSDMVFWPAVAVCATFVVFAAVQFIGENQRRSERPVIEYLDASGKPMSAKEIERIKKAQR